MEFLDRLQELFELQLPFWELVWRAALVYFAVLVFLRIIPRRMAGELAAMDLVLILLIARSAGRALGDFESLSDGIVQMLTMGAIALAINALSFRYAFVRKLIEAEPLRIIKDGKIVRRNLRREFVTEQELERALRENGVSDISEVKTARVESEGEISIIKKPR